MAGANFFPEKKHVLLPGDYIVPCASVVFFIIPIEPPHKVPLVNSTGRSFEKALVVEILRDNLDGDGERYGDQLVKLETLTGKLRGNWSPPPVTAVISGRRLPRRAYTVTITRISGETNVISIYRSIAAKPSISSLRFSLLALASRGETRRKIRAGAAVYLAFHHLFASADGLPGLFTICRLGAGGLADYHVR